MKKIFTVNFDTVEKSCPARKKPGDWTIPMTDNITRCVAFPDGIREVTIPREGRGRVIVPANAVWDDFFESAGADFPERERPSTQMREEF